MFITVIGCCCLAVWVYSTASDFIEMVRKHNHNAVDVGGNSVHTRGVH